MTRTKKSICATALMVAVLTPGGSFAEDVEFNANVSTTCSIAVTRNGTLGVRQNARVLNSQGAGGTNGRATVVTTQNIFSLAVDQPTGFAVSPVADTTPSDFRGRIASTGATVFNWTTATQPLNAGTNNVRIAFRARKAVGQSFPNGFYQGIVVIRCE